MKKAPYGKFMGDNDAMGSQGETAKRRGEKSSVGIDRAAWRPEAPEKKTGGTNGRPEDC